MGWVHVLLFIAACDTLSAALMPRVKKPSVTIITSSLQNMSLVASQEVSLPMQTIEIQKRSRRSVGGDNVINVKVDITIDGEIEFDDENDDGSKRTKRAVGACKFKGKIYASGQPWEVTKNNKVYLCYCPDIGSISKKIKCARKAVEAPKPQTSFASSSTSATTSEFVTAEAIVCRAGEEELALGESVQTTHEGVPYTCECMINNGQPDIACTPQSEPGETETVYGDPGTVDFFCNIPDGRRIPAGETFIHTVGSVEYTCKCPANLGPEEQELGQIQIECEQRLDGGNVPEGEPFKYHFRERQFSCTCDEATVGAFRCSMPDGSTANAGDEKVLEKDGVQYLCKCPLTSPPEGHSIQCSHRKHASFSSH
ncbi:hypothetical protein CAPTEDRAFT_218009 [Capitella teleta]|uniref:Uncharacterized protein n=1 Tax=Capitella teleta TaxID=283909 RepID=R7UTC1_CAPTE|nr:hypothetical protein CAPTEDRAFT_218009 [Capitella teleta]|eukprot:ELU09759.1 hypothetical protein CAPTEDRAFT_218009 [Capitella teleta]